MHAPPAAKALAPPTRAAGPNAPKVQDVATAPAYASPTGAASLMTAA